MNIKKRLEEILNDTLKQSSNEQIYNALVTYTKELSKERELIYKEKKLYYISAEFLIGKLLTNNLINLGIYDDVTSLLSTEGIDIQDIEEIEKEPALGSGGLGRLASCYLDSIATLNISGDGIGLNYHLGLFQQKFFENKQVEIPDPWITTNSWLNKTNKSYEIKFKDFSLKSNLYEIDILGYLHGRNKLRLFDIETVNEYIVHNGINFDKSKIKENLTLFLYPNDSDEQGKLLRIYQQYFLVSSGAQLIIDEYLEKNTNLLELDKHVVIQINDTHPSMIIPELVRILVEKGISIDEAIDVVKKTCAYTNHTILAEALEKWPKDYLERVVPSLIPIIEILNQKVIEKYQDTSLHIIDEHNLVHMAKMDIHYSFSVNGVASLHTDILKKSELKNFYEIYPYKFNNKTNGITFRRWLLSSNKELVKFIDKHGFHSFRDNPNELSGLLCLLDNEKALDELVEVKQKNKVNLANYIQTTCGTSINPDSIFDIQIKRLHEYKRQQMNVLYIIYKYLEIKKGNYPKTPITFIFGAKAASEYKIAKDIIHLILSLKELVLKDEEVSKYINIVMMENYNVSKAEKFIPACDVSEQISLASKEASGTGNMKLMLNGAVTIGTLDGANVEIKDLVGNENIYIFGVDSETVINHYKNHSYNPVDLYTYDPLIKELVDFIISKELLEIGDANYLNELHNELINKDWYMTLLDLKDYINVKEKMFSDYEDKLSWARKSLVNIATSGYFSSDRSVKEYNDEIWKIH